MLRYLRPIMPALIVLVFVPLGSATEEGTEQTILRSRYVLREIRNLSAIPSLPSFAATMAR